MTGNDAPTVTPTDARTVTRMEVLAAEPVESLAAMLDIDRPEGSDVPALWHWLYLLDRRAQRDLGPDGHPTSGIPAPPGPGRRRMFAGGRVRTLRPLRTGAPATRVTRVASTVDKQGRTGPLTFVTVRHEVSQHDRLCVVDEQDIVYRDPGGAALPAAQDPPPPPDGPSLALDVDERMLFRFSALTYNAHRIHYDRAWARHEGYDALVIHGPLQALMMGELMRRRGVDLVGREYAYRLISPMVGAQQMTVYAGADGLSSGAQVRGAAGRVTALSTVTPGPR